MFFSDDCAACHSVVAEIAKGIPGPRIPLHAVLTSTEFDGVGVLDPLPPGITRVRGVRAERIVKDMAIRATPLAIAIVDGLIVAKGYLRDTADLVWIARPLYLTQAPPTALTVIPEKTAAA